MKLAEYSWTDVDRPVDVVLLPVGSTEQHGPHAPLGTDTLLAERIAEQGADATPHDALVAPSFPFGVAEEHRHFAGTLWLRPETFRAAVSETIESLAHHGWDRVIVVNGHGGNVDALREACARITRDEIAYSVPFTWFEAVDTAPSKMGHGGPVETAGVMAVRPDLIDAGEFERARVGGADRWGDFVSGVNMAYDSAEFTESGVVGDPTAATPETGSELIADAADALVAVIDAAVRRD